MNLAVNIEGIAMRLPYSKGTDGYSLIEPTQKFPNFCRLSVPNFAKATMDRWPSRAARMLRGGKAFSLIELMVVISIVAILVALGSVSYTTAQKKARDSSRRSEILSISDGFEQYFSTANNYDSVANCATMTSDATIFPAGIPDESKPSWDAYYYACTINDFTVCAHLESDTGNSDMGVGPVVPSFDNSGDEEWFCIINQQ